MKRTLRGAGVLALLVLVWGGATAQEEGDDRLPPVSVEDVMRALDALAVYDERLPRDSFDLQAALAESGTEADAILAWVRRETTYLPYPGALRGAEGVLMDRRGNSLDRALLLVRLLELAGHEARLARGRLDAEHAQALLDRWHEMPPAPTMAPEEANRRIVEAYDAAGFDTDVMVSWLDEQASGQAAATAALAARADRLTTQLGALVEPWARPADDGAAALEAAADHWWVQVSEGGAWRDLDPAAPEGAGPLVTATETLAADALPRQERQDVVLRVVAESMAGGGIERATLLEESLAADGPLAIFRLGFLAMGAVPEAEAGTREQVDDMVATALAETEWLPVLHVDSAPRIWRYASIDGEVFDSNGMHPEATRLGRAMGDAIEDSLGGVIDLFGSLPTGEEEDEAGEAAMPELQRDRALTALWIEVEVESPGRQPMVERRTVFDLYDGLPEGERATAPLVVSEEMHRARALALLTQYEGIVATARPDDVAVAHLAARHWLDQRDRFHAIAEAAGTGDSAAVAEAVELLEPWPASLFSLALARDLGSGAGPEVDSPLVLMLFRTVDRDPDGTLGGTSGIDIVARPSVHAGGAEEAFADRLAQGVRDTLLEAALHGEGMAVANAALLLEEKPEAWRVIGPGDALDDLPPALARLVAPRHAAGELIVVPQGAGEDIAAVWWRVDPHSGRTLGMDGAGRGSAFFEYVLKNTTLTREQIVAYRALACVLISKVSLGTLIVGLLNPAAESDSALEAMRSPVYRISRSAVKQLACFISASAFGVPGTTLYRVGATIGVISIGEAVVDFSIGRYLSAIAD